MERVFELTWTQEEVAAVMRQRKRGLNEIWKDLHPVFQESVRGFAEMCVGLQKLKIAELARIEKKDIYKPKFAIDCFRGAFDVDPITLRPRERICQVRPELTE